MNKYILLLFSALFATAIIRGSEFDKDRKGKVFSLFTVVNFQNSACVSTSSGSGVAANRNGTCYTSTECTNKNGNAQGNCASGFGVCCVFVISTSGSTISENCSYVQNPGFPTGVTATTGFTYTVNKVSNDVCFLRLDFETFSIQGVGGTNIALEGVCMDTFTVTTPTAQVVPTICGLNSGYHMYVDVGANAGDSATLAFTFTGTTTTRSWDIKITQVECSNPSANCLQYQEGLTGRIETFNYQANNDNHLNNQDYTVCIRPQAGYCCIQYQVCGGEAMGMTISPTKVGGTPTAFQDDACLTADYIVIPGSAASCIQTTGDSTLYSRYCGSFLSTTTAAAANSPICDCTPPFTVDVVTNNVADVGSMNTIQSKGVCLEYMQIPC